MFAPRVKPVDKNPLPFTPRFAGTRFGAGIVGPT
jgi:hypothetical protein